ncbi:YdcF family protein [Candidatus Electrothrix sp.]|uniref:YdcF family protein n=1 Tax=Candidatus Electrothrix sp. TaxID=2170559 RepID=UPI004057AB1A
MLTKLLPLPVYPLGMGIGLIVVSFIFLRGNRKWIAGLTLLLSVIVLWGASTQKTAELVMHSLERHYPPVAVQDTPKAEAIVVLGGVTRGMVPGNGLTDLSGGVDRIVHAARLFKAEKAPLLVLSGGNAPGYRSEAEDMADILQLMDIPADKMLLETKSRNTQQNALYCQEIFQQRGIRNILLVTSASHMRRAEAIFNGIGVFVIPAATDYQLVERAPSFLDWLPQAGALEMTTKGIKEYIGYWVYLLTETVKD